MGIVNSKEREMITEKEKVVQALKGWQFVRGKHGCLYDRGSADSYYGRRRQPHYGGVGGDSGQRVEVSDAESVAEYNAGYDYNERFGDKKNWD
jgi:hypothetical protein